MAISASAVWEIRSSATASNVNGGFFVTGASGTDYSQQDAAQYNLTGCTSAGADAIILNANAAANMVGNGAHVISGTNATAGWYEIISVDPGVSITVDRNWGTGAVANGVVNIGGALSLGSSDDAVFESAPSGGGNTFWVKQGSYTIGGAVSISASAFGGTQKPHFIKGYATARGDNPTGSTRPTFICAANAFAVGTCWDIYYLQFTSTAANGLGMGAGSKLVNVKATNTSTTAGRAAITTSSDAFIASCEAISYRGTAINGGTTMTTVFGSYIHDSNIGISSSATTSPQAYSNNIIMGCVDSAIKVTAANTANCFFQDNTFYGAENKLGTGINFATGVTDSRIVNNIIYGFVTGVTHADTQTVGYDAYNCYNNNTTDATNWTLGTGSVTTAPSFTSVSQVTVTTATTSASTLTKAGATFVTSGVTAGRDFVYITAGAGATAGVYGISSVDSETQLTLDIAPGNSAGDVSAQITTGRNFAIGTALKALGSPGPFPGGYSTGYMDIGAVQRQESSSGGGSSGGFNRFGG